jgi:hypothetical protein
MVMPVDRQRVEKLLTQHFYHFLEETPLGADDYSIDDMGLVTTHVGVYLAKKFSTGILPIKFKYVYGDFSLSGGKLTTLAGCPSSVTGDFYCEGNRLTSLEHAPSGPVQVGCSRNKLTSLEHCPPNTEELACDENLLTCLDSCPPTKYCYAPKNPFQHFRNTPAHIDEVVVSYSPELPLLGLLTVKTISILDPVGGNQLLELTNIMNQYAGQGRRGSFAAKKALIEAGFESNARW